jgi:hypothetical protein
MSRSESAKKWWEENKNTEQVKNRNKAISDKQKGKKLPENHPFKKGGFTGYHHTESSKKKIGENGFTKGKPNNKYRHTEEAKKAISEKLKGEKSYLWKGGITPLNLKIRQSLQYKEWLKKLFKRDNYTCQFCGKYGRKEVVQLNGHHKTIPFHLIIKENKIKSIEEALNCKELWDINNGITLCKSCHSKLHKKNGQN